MMTAAPSPSPESYLAQTPSKSPVRFTPPLIAMVVIIATAFIAITYSRTISRRFLLLRRQWRQWRRRRRLLRSYVPSSVGESPGEDDGYQLFSPYGVGVGLDDDVIKRIPLTIHTRKKTSVVNECAVCLLEFEDNDYVRTLPVCFHAFHVECIDIWLRCHANCPLCRSTVFRPESPFIPVMSARIRPDFDDVIVDVEEIQPDSTEITLMNQIDERFDPRNLLLKRSYSFGFERNIGSERLVIEPATASPWRYRRGSFWNKRPSPFSKSRVFSFRYYRGMKSPFFRRRTGSYTDSVTGTGGSSSSRRRKSFASPIFMRQSVMNSGMFSSSRLRSGDPEALLSPERYNRR